MTLTQAAIITKKGIVVFIGLIILGLVFKILFDFGTKIYVSYNPPPEEQPDLKYGKLPKIVFPASKSSANYTYTLDTKTGNLPQNPRLTRIYFIPQAGVSLLSSQRSKQLAANLGFTQNIETISSVKIRVKNSSDNSITIDIPTGNFYFDRTSEFDSSQTSDRPLGSPEQIVQEFKGFLGGSGLLNSQLAEGRSNVVYNAPTQPEADMATVSLWPKNLNDLSFVTPDYNHGLVKATITKQPTARFSKLDYYFWPIDETSFATYPLRSVSQAFEQLKAGSSYISIEPTSKQASISDVSLAYYESQDYTPYLQPVYVFTGSNFAAYVSAVDPSQTQ